MWCIAQTMGPDVAHSGSLCLASDDTAPASHWSTPGQSWPLIGWEGPCWPSLARHSGIFMSGSCNNKSRSDWIPAWLIRSEIPQIRFHLMTEIYWAWKMFCLDFTREIPDCEVLRMNILLMIEHPAHVCINERILNIYCCKEAILLIKRTSDDCSWNKRSLNNTMPLTGASQPGSQWRVEAGLIADSFDCCYEGVSWVSGPDNLMMCFMAPCWSNQTSIKQLIHLNNHKITTS